MRFCDFVTDYKYRVLGIRIYSRGKELPPSIIIGLVICGIFCGTGFAISTIREGIYQKYSYIVLSVVLALALFYLKTGKVQDYFRSQQREYSKERMSALIRLLMEYGIDYNNKEKIRLLIECVDNEKRGIGIWRVLSQVMKAAIGCAIIPVFIDILKKQFEDIEYGRLLIVITSGALNVVILLGVIYVLVSFIVLVFWKDLLKYEELKYDLQQLIIFE